MTALKWLLIFAVVGFCGVLALMYVFQRAMMYFPDPRRVAPADAGLPQAEEVTFASADGETLLAWYVAPREGKPLVLYFQGNAEGLPARVGRFTWLTADGTGLLALNYRGYGGSSGTPTEDGLIADAVAAYGFARAHYPAGRIVLFGESLGTAVTVALAAGHEVAGVILDAPFTSAAEVGAAAYPFAPVRWFMKDKFALGRAHRPRRRAAFGAARRGGPHRANPLRRKAVRAWRASPNASCASRKVATSTSTISARRKWCRNFSPACIEPGSAAT